MQGLKQDDTENTYNGKFSKLNPGTTLLCSD